MIFIFKADIEFEAVDIDDAFVKLRDHFDSLLEEGESELNQIGEMTIQPKKEEA